MTQQTLFATDQASFEAWKEFHANNLRVWELFRRFAEESLTRGKKAGARRIGERIRWEVPVDTTDEEYKVNDHHWPYYARLLAGLDRRFANYFVFKNARFDSSIEEIVAFHNGMNT